MNNTVRIFKRIVRMLKSHSYAIVVKYYVCCRVVRYYAIVVRYYAIVVKYYAIVLAARLSEAVWPAVHIQKQPQA